MAHTPAPWFVSPIQQDDYGFTFATVGPFETTGAAEPNHVEETICEVRGINHPCEANARLIAAAPDLLQCLHETSDALRALVYACETEGWSGQHALATWKFVMAHNADLEDRVNAAIAKAEGKVA
jgi:hypothetical protein